MFVNIFRMRIDAHQHFWRYNPNEYGWIDDSMARLRRDFLPSDLQPELERAGFDRCIAVQARQTIEETRWLLDLADASPFMLGVVGWVDLQSDDVRLQLHRLAANPKLLGVRRVVQAEPDDRFMLRPEFLRGVAALEEFGLTNDILIYSRHLPVAAEFVKRFPRHRFVLDHLAKPYIRKQEIEPWRSDLRRLAEFPNVYCKISGMVTEADWGTWTAEQIAPYINVALDCFGAERLMMGSDWPVCTVAASYARTMSLMIEFLKGHSDDERDAILGGTAAKFWRLRT
jgi:L-fuconolactonase